MPDDGSQLCSSLSALGDSICSSSPSAGSRASGCWFALGGWFALPASSVSCTSGSPPPGTTGFREEVVSGCSSVDKSGVEGVSARPTTGSAGVSVAVLPLAAESTWEENVNVSIQSPVTVAYSLTQVNSTVHQETVVCVQNGALTVNDCGYVKSRSVTSQYYFFSSCDSNAGSVF